MQVFYVLTVLLITLTVPPVLTRTHAHTYAVTVTVAHSLTMAIPGHEGPRVDTVDDVVVVTILEHRELKQFLFDEAKLRIGLPVAEQRVGLL